MSSREELWQFKEWATREIKELRREVDALTRERKMQQVVDNVRKHMNERERRGRTHGLR